MIGLTDNQLQTIMLAAGTLPPEKRGTYLQRVSAHLTLKCGTRFTDGDVAVAVQSALQGLVHDEAAAPRLELATG